MWSVGMVGSVSCNGGWEDGHNQRKTLRELRPIYDNLSTQYGVARRENRYGKMRLYPPDVKECLRQVRLIYGNLSKQVCLYMWDWDELTGCCCSEEDDVGREWQDRHPYDRSL